MSGDIRDPVSVLLPTVEWGDACETVAEQLRPGDELLIICDTPADPVASHDPPDGVEVLVAGEPEACSGKANAIAYGMEQASNDRFIWTDDDFDRDDDWIDRLVSAGAAHGPATAVPVFYGNGWWRLLEPWLGILFAILFYWQVGGFTGIAWGGGVTFTRDELTGDVATLAADLRTVLSDDALLSERLPSLHVVRSMVTPVEVPGDWRAVWHRALRFARIAHLHGDGGAIVGLLVNGSLVVAALAIPLVFAPVVTVAIYLAAVVLDVRRSAAVFAYPGVFLLPVVVVAGAVVTEFEWGGRRYRYRGVGDVEVLDG